MCDPFTLIGGALSIAGSVVQAQQQAAFVEAQNAANREAYEMSSRARRAELDRQKVLEDESAGEWQNSLEFLTRDNQEQRFDDDATAFLDALDARPSTAEEGLTLSGQNQAAPEFQAEMARAVSKQAADTRRRLEALAKLGAYGGVEVGNNVNLQLVNNDLNTINGIRRGSLGVSNFEQDVPAAQVSPGSSIMGDILSGAGGLFSRGAGVGRGFGGGVTTRPMGIY